MTKVIGVRFRKAGKVYYFSPGDEEIKAGQHMSLPQTPEIFVGFKDRFCSLAILMDTGINSDR